jgi:ubiquinone/menaquinone biosynthesis C-methylase UbiE
MNSDTIRSSEKESEHNDVYGSTFALYGPAQLEEFCGFLEKRLAVNELPSRALFEGKRCLDAGAGNGRGALVMLKSGAESVTLVDVSTENIRSAERNLQLFGFVNFDVRLSTLEDLPLPDDSFDFVWCNGVLMHTANPDQCLKEITRVLRPGGKSWIYVYGAGGVYWYLIRTFRQWFEDTPASVALDSLQLMGLPVRYIAEYMDDWKTPFLRTYTDFDFARRLRELGFSHVQRLWRGVPYDTCERLIKFPQDAALLGEGDLRYLVTKGHTPPRVPSTPLSNDDWGSVHQDLPVIRTELCPKLDTLTAMVSRNTPLALLVASTIQRHLRDLMARDESFDMSAFASFLDAVTMAAQRLSAPVRS